MVELNLVPWRSSKKIYDQKQQRTAVMLAVLVSVSVWALLHHYFQIQLDDERQQLKILQLSLARLATKRDNKTVATESGFTPQRLAEFVDQLSVETESGVCYRTIAYENHEVILAGEAWSTSALLNKLSHLRMSSQFAHYQISKLQRNDRFTTLDYRVLYKEISRDKKD